ncbi:hypothetical protein VOLCADRAFT_118034 [Volvox carteri f. nagariensis]|uniref:Uncharacterized protein n=1 Tax=Volvox carteri f. nagariensis TaxID=3068 RepID=D8U0C3_VOLCA|nr:uncharacterized protein VOLCADRAFT_118034 [Volvox carteri f. nagariensis]EFJ46837.1 hypothetical protein VOLCADRAFT_118034 [Volvox carteri f. nagariensis]|eukprot:XP_002952046.1 hypothetical protein VOLCADRAFT_118034 [Volvox carteri f. nagariensis]
MAQQAPRVAPLAATSLCYDAAMRHELKAAGAKREVRPGDHPYISTALPSPGSGSGGGGGGGFQKVVMISPKTSMSAIPPPWGISAREGAFGGGQAGDAATGSSSLQALAARPLSSRGRPGAIAAAVAAAGGNGAGGDGGIVSPGATGAAAAAAGAVAGRPASGVKWAKPHQHVKVQSARPPGCRGEIELDPSVWQANIAMQLQRPPSRQKPPPEALHLWTPEQQMGMLASGAGLMGRPGGGGRPLGARPQSAAPTTYRGTRPISGPSVKAQGPVGEDRTGASARPPSRQKPPPLSTLLEHDDFPPPPAGSRRQRGGGPFSDVMMDVVVSGSSSEEGDDDLEGGDDEDDDLQGPV